MGRFTVKEDGMPDHDEGGGGASCFGRRGRQDSGYRAEFAGTNAFSRTERLLLCLRYADGLNDEEISALTRTPVTEVRASLTELVARVRVQVAANSM
jgi:DNA-directed RNA polymerase specialized sigma24 family protein